MTLNPETLLPLPGRAFVGMNPQYADFDGCIAIPLTAQKRTQGRIGQVISVTLYPVNKLSIVFKHGKTHSVPAFKDNDQYADLLGEYVVCRNATLVHSMIYEVRLEHIMSIVPEDAIPESEDVPRCKRCRSKGEANIILGGDGYCPVCGFDEADRHISQDCIMVPSEYGDMQIANPHLSESDIDAFVRNPAEADHIRRTGGKSIEGKIISYPGQVNRSRLEKTFDHELNEIFKRRKK